MHCKHLCSASKVKRFLLSAGRMARPVAVLLGAGATVAAVGTAELRLKAACWFTPDDKDQNHKVWTMSYIQRSAPKALRGRIKSSLMVSLTWLCMFTWHKLAL